MTIPTAPAINVAVCEGQPFLRSGVCSLLEREPNITVVADPSDPTDLARVVERYRPQVLLLGDGFSAAPFLESLPVPAPAAVVLAGDLEAERLIALLCGAVRCIVHRAGHCDDLVKAVHAAAAGRCFLGQEFTDTLFDLVRTRPPTPNLTLRHLEMLTMREHDVLQLVCDGKPNREIAQILRISEKTVKFHISNMLAKTATRSRCELIAVVADLKCQPRPIRGHNP